MERGGFAYITTTKNNTALYVGSTSDLSGRMYEHKTKAYPDSFSARYNIDKLVYFEYFEFVDEAIIREQQIKAGSRAKKLALINNMNPEWRDLTDELEELDY